MIGVEPSINDVIGNLLIALTRQFYFIYLFIIFIYLFIYFYFFSLSQGTYCWPFSKGGSYKCDHNFSAIDFSSTIFE
jgi:hypothetical protein